MINISSIPTTRSSVSRADVPHAQRAQLGCTTSHTVPTDPVRHRREVQQARSLLFVATTRARDSLDIFWHGTPSPFLAPLMTAGR
ncbi:hypothetical protein GTW41_27890 [Streptomyces sp. SID4941]|nr:hypothetical protein [Streptomyces sp. SID4941]